MTQGSPISPPKPKRGRKPRFDRDQTIATLADLFWDRGYDGIALSDVMDATGLSKSSLYNSFGDKDDLFRKALSHYHNEVVEQAAEWLASDDEISPWDTLDQLLSGPANDVFGSDDRRGCFLCNTASDGRGRAPDIDALVSTGFDRLIEGLSALLKRAAPKSESATRAQLARLIITTYAGMRVRSRHARTRDELDSVQRSLLISVRLTLTQQ
jgi:TetR/AcrR family transcriptional repressor of nem operon